ncbi:Transposon Tf2-6 polyprotein [Labeo rohita]|uniref:Transposon Tf2-6 polyprotein n=1 Tax=Labeo rohita TaxID=84645 RepID=A0ABQ8L6M9_LABRO|nr:Transposon Tf2-6 polyprotein [Labeo rohita]
MGNSGGRRAKHFVVRNFYVDDGLTSVSTSEEAIALFRNTQKMLAESNLRLHKIPSNSKTVMKAFPKKDHAEDLKDLDLGVDSLPVQHSLGLTWNLETDSFNFHVHQEEKPFMRMGVLSTVNSLYDPLGFLAPVVVDWDTPLSIERQAEWNEWRCSLTTLEQLQIKRLYVPVSLTFTQKKELCFFSDASTVAIGAVAYFKVVDSNNQCQVGFVMGKAKLAPCPAHTIPRLELCAAMLAVEMYEMIRDEIDEEIDSVKFFTDSRIVLGYIYNVRKRFYVYIANSVARIRKSTNPDQCCYVNTNDNPADLATKAIPAERLQDVGFLDHNFYSREMLKN